MSTAWGCVPRPSMCPTTQNCPPPPAQWAPAGAEGTFPVLCPQRCVLARSRVLAALPTPHACPPVRVTRWRSRRVSRAAGVAMMQEPCAGRGQPRAEVCHAPRWAPRHCTLGTCRSLPGCSGLARLVAAGLGAGSGAQPVCVGGKRRVLMQGVAMAAYAGY